MTLAFHTTNKIGKAKPFSERSVFAVSTADALLASLQREKMLNDIKLLAQVPEEAFAVLYKPLIDNFVEFVQVLPVANEARLASLMDEGLLRAVLTLQVQNGENSGQPLSPLMLYVLFSAALLLDIGFVVANRVVNLVDKHGTFLANWQPHCGSMPQVDGYYKIRRGGGMQPWLCRKVTPLFARQVMPTLGFNWIADDPYAFDMWLALLIGEHNTIESLKLYMDRATELLDEIKIRHEFLIPTALDIQEAKELMLGEEFLEWLEKSIAEGKISVNKADSNVHVMREGGVQILLRIPEIFKEFSNQHPQRPDANMVLEQFKKMGFLRLVDGAIKTERFVFTSGKLTSAEYAKQAATKMAMFREMELQRNPQAADTGILDAKFDPIDKTSRNLSNFGFQLGTLIDGPTAICLDGRININIETPANNFVRMENLATDIKPTENYPDAIFKTVLTPENLVK